MLEISNLEKCAEKKLLVTDINLTLHQGEILALVGEHQSGKSLLSRLILTVATKTGGNIKIKGHRLLGAFIHSEQFLPKETIQSIIKDYCKLNNVDYNAKHTKNILTVLNLKNVLHRQIDKLTASEQDRVKMALPLITQAEILILDAPFTNLTAQESKDLRVLLRKISLELKTAIIVTALNMREIEEFCDTIAIIDDGCIIALKTYNEMILKEYDNAKLSLTVAEPNYAAQVIETELQIPTKICGDKVLVNTAPENVQYVVDRLVKKNITVLAANRAFRSLQFQYLEIIQNRKKYY